jgi:GTP-binding protein HflX
MAATSHAIGRQIGVLVDRLGSILFVIVGDAKSLLIPELSHYPLGRKSLRALRLLHTHLKNEPLTEDDLTDLSLLRLDAVFAFGVKDGLPGHMYWAHLLPDRKDGKSYETAGPFDYRTFNVNFKELIEALEDEMERVRAQSFDLDDTRERAILVSVSMASHFVQQDSLSELKELAISSDVVVLDTVIQRPGKINPKHLLGIGKIKELAINALQKGATLLIFDQNLSPSQLNAISELVELKVMDRAQLILDIFARRAHSRDGKVQVELAQLKYRLPRLTGKGIAMSRLTGGIGGRGPGEMKLEIDRRRVRDRIALLEKELKTLSHARKQRRARRAELNIPIISIVGYTNAGKSTLLNNLTKSSTFVEDKMFATLDTASRRLRFPKERDVIITDTVGFIRDLPEDLLAAFKATLEELEDAHLLLHLVDISNPRFEAQIKSVEKILEELQLAEKPRLIVFNKVDQMESISEVQNTCNRYSAIAISAIQKATFPTLLEAIETRLWNV